MPDSHANFAYSTVATAPSPATTGTSLVVAAGQGALFPTPPFNATIWPAGQRPLASTAEIVRVTAIATDTLTITREQEGTTARTVVVGDQIAATITNKTLTDVEIVYNVKAYGATGDGSTDDTTTIQAAIDAAEAAGGGTVWFPPGTYKITAVLTIDASYVRLVGEKATIDGSTIAAAGALMTQFAIKFQGTIGSTIAVTGDIAVGDTTVATTTATLAAGDIILLTSDQNYADGAVGTYGNRGALHRIKSIDSASALTMTERSFFAYASASTVTVQKVTPLKGIVVDGISILMGGDGDVHNGILFDLCDNPQISNVSVDGCEDVGLHFERCWGPRIEKSTIENADSPTAGIGNTGYGVALQNGTRNALVRACRMRNCRHAVAGGAGGPAKLVSILCTIENNDVEQCGLTDSHALDCHEETWCWDFSNNRVTGGHGGILIRGSGCKVRGNTVRNTGSTGILVSSFDVNSDGLISTQISDNLCEETGAAGILVKGTADCRNKGVQIINNRLRRNRLNNIEVWLSDDVEISHNDCDTTYDGSGSDGNNIRLVGSSTSSRCERVTIIGGKYRGGQVGSIRAGFTNDLRILWPSITSGNLNLSSCTFADGMLADGQGVSFGTTTGTKLGTATTQKLGIWNATPIVQPANTITTRKVLENIGLVATGGTAGPTVQAAVFDFTTDVATGDGKHYIHVPPSLNGLNLVYVHARVITAGTTGTTDIQIARTRSGSTVDMLSTKLTIDSAETGSDTAATAAVNNATNDDVATNDVLRIDVDAVSTTPPKGLIVTMAFG